MSRIGRKPIPLTKGVELRVEGDRVLVKGPLGELERTLPPATGVVVDAGTARVEVRGDEHDRRNRAMQGLARALINNMVVGVTKGYERSLDLIGVGYRAKLDGKRLSLSLGFPAPVPFQVPADVSVEIRDAAGQKENQIILKGTDKDKIGQLAADLRRLRPPEPYKGKGIRYTGERIRQKAGKAGAR